MSYNNHLALASFFKLKSKSPTIKSIYLLKICQKLFKNSYLKFFKVESNSLIYTVKQTKVETYRCIDYLNVLLISCITYCVAAIVTRDVIVEQTLESRITLFRHCCHLLFQTYSYRNRMLNECSVSLQMIFPFSLNT